VGVDYKYDYDASVIVLSYNQENFIFDTLNSIEIQDLDSIQVVVGDDASVDSTTDIISKFSESSRHDYVKIFRKENVGITENFNACLSNCKGKYIFLLGGDDLFLDNKMKLQFEYMNFNPDVFISFHDAYIFDSNTGRTLLKYSDLFNVTELSVESLIRHGTFFTGCTVAVRNFENIPKCNWRIKFSSDWLWYIEVLISSGGKLGEIDSVLAKYRRHISNITSTKNFKLAYIETEKSLNHVLESYPEYEIVAREALAERQFAYFLKGLFGKNLNWSLALLLRSLNNSILSPLFFLKLRFNSLSYRLRKK
tara:strand:+ start:8599 stop:9525 length:927 start_codon:yes stop_codon:yes gene_type:complete